VEGYRRFLYIRYLFVRGMLEISIKKKKTKIPKINPLTLPPPFLPKNPKNIKK
jgi:hypothetical protein